MKPKNLKNITCTGKRVFVRSDLNVPLKNKQILDDYRLQAIVPTLDYILQQGGKVILATHLGRPKGQFDANLSTRLLIPWFEKHGYSIDFASDIAQAEQKSTQNFDTILLLENLRFLPEERYSPNTLEAAQKLAKKLSSLASIYINDAFGVMHRNDTSVTLVPEYFDPEHRGIGFLVAKEIETLENLKKHPKQPFVLVIGGSKLHDKIDMIEKFLQAPKSVRIKTIVAGGLIAQAFLYVQGYNMGIAPIDDQTQQIAKKILTQAHDAGVTIILPSDFYLELTHNFRSRALLIDQIPSNGVIVDIGPQTVDIFSHILAQAETIFANGTMGIYETPAYAEGTKKVLQAISQSNAFSLIGGGDINAAAHLFGVAKDIDFCSTGGGATLAFLGAEDPFEDLPGLHVLVK